MLCFVTYQFFTHWKIIFKLGDILYGGHILHYKCMLMSHLDIQIGLTPLPPSSAFVCFWGTPLPPIQCGRNLYLPLPKYQILSQIPNSGIPLYSEIPGKYPFTLAKMIDKINIGCRWSSSVFATDGDQWHMPIRHENQWHVGCRRKKTDKVQWEPMFFCNIIWA